MVKNCFFIREAFDCFHEFYVWDEFYVDLFKKLRADEEQFFVLKENHWDVKDDINYPKTKDYTYYLQAENKEKLQKICMVLNQLKDRGYKVSVRPHPIYSEIQTIKSIFREIDVEKTSDVSIEESIQRTKYAISLFSTVLQESYKYGTGVIIDDVADVDAYIKLKDLDYIMLSKEHRLLSEVIGEN